MWPWSPTCYPTQPWPGPPLHSDRAIGFWKSCCLPGVGGNHSRPGYQAQGSYRLGHLLSGISLVEWLSLNGQPTNKNPEHWTASCFQVLLLWTLCHLLSPLQHCVNSMQHVSKHARSHRIYVEAPSWLKSQRNMLIWEEFSFKAQGRYIHSSRFTEESLAISLLYGCLSWQVLSF